MGLTCCVVPRIERCRMGTYSRQYGGEDGNTMESTAGIWWLFVDFKHNLKRYTTYNRLLQVAIFLSRACTWVQPHRPRRLDEAAKLSGSDTALLSSLWISWLFTFIHYIRGIGHGSKHFRLLLELIQYLKNEELQCWNNLTLLAICREKAQLKFGYYFLKQNGVILLIKENK